MFGAHTQEERLHVSPEAATGFRRFLTELPYEMRDRLHKVCDDFPLVLPAETFADPDDDDPANAQDCYRTRK